jgi:hypothetical protein
MSLLSVKDVNSVDVDQYDWAWTNVCAEACLQAFRINGLSTRLMWPRSQQPDDSKVANRQCGA